MSAKPCTWRFISSHENGEAVSLNTGTMSMAKAPNGEIIRKQSTFKQTVYKSAIDSPFNIKWPRLSTQLSNRLIDNLIKILQPIGEYRKAKLMMPKGDKASSIDIPGIVSEQRLLVGINNVTKHLEHMIQKKNTGHDIVENADMDKVSGMTLTPAIFLCRRDIKPVHLCSHLLTMAVLADVKLVPLPLDAEKLLSQALDLHRVSVVFLEVFDSDAEEPLRLAVNEVPAVEAPWLAGSVAHNSKHYSTTRIKILKTIGTFTKKSK